jgi:hypothetical protein
MTTTQFIWPCVSQFSSTSTTLTMNTTLTVTSAMTSQTKVSPNDACLVNYWPIFNGNMSDLIGSAHMSQGSLTSFTLDRFGNVNSALALNGGFTQVPVGDFFNTLQFSVAAWVYPSQVGTWARIFDFGTSGSTLTNSIHLCLTSNKLNSPAFVIYDQTPKIIGFGQSKMSLEQNKWNFITVTFNGSQLCLFINGTLVNSTQVLPSSMPKVQRTNNFFGKSHYPTDGVSWSYLDEIRFYNLSLTQTQIIDLMNENDLTNSFSACPYTTTTTSTYKTTVSTSNITPSTTSSKFTTSLSSSILSTVTSKDSSTATVTDLTSYIPPSSNLATNKDTIMATSPELTTVLNFTSNRTFNKILF